MTYEEIMDWLQASGATEIVTAKRRIGVVTKHSVGIYHGELKKKAEEIGKDSALAIQLFNSGIYEARVLCSKIFNPDDLTAALAESWVKTFENVEICDAFAIGVFAKSGLATTKAMEWCKRKQKFEKRAGFITLVACCKIDNEVGNDVFEAFLPILEKEAKDDRLHVKQAVDWALKSIGQRNTDLQKAAVSVAYRTIQYGSKTAKWIGRRVLESLENGQGRTLGYPSSSYEPTQRTQRQA